MNLYLYLYIVYLAVVLLIEVIGFIAYVLINPYFFKSTYSIYVMVQILFNLYELVIIMYYNSDTQYCQRALVNICLLYFGFIFLINDRVFNNLMYIYFYQVVYFMFYIVYYCCKLLYSNKTTGEIDSDEEETEPFLLGE